MPEKGPLVPGVGPPNARIAIIGEAPGAQEERARTPFVGGAGQLLEGALLQVGVMKSQVYLDNILPYRPPNNDLKRIKEIGISSPFDYVDRVLEKLEKMKPNVVVACGNLALEALTGKKGIMKWRASILEGLNGMKVIPIIHPAMILRQYDWRPILVLDLKRVKEESKTKEINLPKRNLLSSPTFEEAQEALSKIITKAPPTAVDIELIGGQISCIGFADDPASAVCIPFHTGTGSYWPSFSQEEVMWRMCYDILRRSEIYKIIQNASFELAFLGGLEQVRSLYWDTLVAQHIINPGFRMGLDFLTSIYTREPYYKEEGRSFRPGKDDPNQHYLYNCRDCAVTHEIFGHQHREMEEIGMLNFFFEFSMPFIRVIHELQSTGILISEKNREDARASLVEMMSEAQKELNIAAGKELNTNSYKQVGDFLYKKLALPLRRSRTTGSPATDHDTLVALAAKYPEKAQLLNLITIVRGCRDTISTYLNAKPDPDGRMRSSYSYKETGRLGSSKTLFGTGMNLQNLPRADEDPYKGYTVISKKVRDMLIADPGHTFLEGDSWQAEAIATAAYAGCKKLLDRFRSGLKVHPFVGSLVFGKPEEEITKGTYEYDIGKRCVHAGNYQIGAAKFGRITKLTKEQASKVLSSYYSAFPEIPAWHRNVEDQLKRTRTLCNAFKRIRRFAGRWSPDLVREGIAWLPQSTVVDNVNRAALRLHFIFWNTDIRIVKQDHDSLTYLVPLALADWAATQLKRELEREFFCGTDIISIPAELVVGESWGSTQPYQVKGENDDYSTQDYPSSQRDQRQPNV